MNGGDNTNEFQEIDKLKQDMQMVFDGAILKAIECRHKPGNEIRPYLKFTQEFLERRLEEEYNEYKESKMGHELHDIINICAFLYLRKIEDAANKLLKKV